MLTRRCRRGNERDRCRICRTQEYLIYDCCLHMDEHGYFRRTRDCLKGRNIFDWTYFLRANSGYFVISRVSTFAIACGLRRFASFRLLGNFFF